MWTDPSDRRNPHSSLAISGGRYAGGVAWPAERVGIDVKPGGGQGDGVRRTNVWLFGVLTVDACWRVEYVPAEHSGGHSGSGESDGAGSGSSFETGMTESGMGSSGSMEFSSGESTAADASSGATTWEDPVAQACGGLVEPECVPELAGGVPIDTSRCDSDCSFPLCGDSHLNPLAGETCEPELEPMCRMDCSYCGDGKVDVAAGEQCDGVELCDNCMSTCGNGVIEPEVGEECDEGVDNSDTPGAFCDTSCVRRGLLVFVSSRLYFGDFAMGGPGIEAAHLECEQMAAELPDLQGGAEIRRFRAWLSLRVESFNITSPKIDEDIHAATCDEAYFLPRSVDGRVLVTQSLAQTIDFGQIFLKNPINVDEEGEPVVDTVWTATGVDGSISQLQNDCYNWSATDSIVQVGDTSQKGAGWTDAGIDSCADLRRIYCFEACADL